MDRLARFKLEYQTDRRHGSDVRTPNLVRIHESQISMKLMDAKRHKVWRLGHKLATFATAHLPVGTAFSFSLNEKETVTFTFRRRHNRRKAAGKLSFHGHPGHNKVNFQGRLSRSKRLSPGAYTMTIVAKSSGKTSKAASLRFTIAR